MNQTNSAAKEMPKNIGLDKWADIGFEWVGGVPVTDFSRLTEQAAPAQMNSTQPLKVRTTLGKQDGILWLNFDVAGQLTVPCQRCLEALTIDVTDEYRLAILADESQVEQVQNAEFVLMGELGSSRMLPIKDLLEDELLLVLPLSPRHDDCDMPIDMVDDDEVADNPFAALAILKGKLN